MNYTRDMRTMPKLVPFGGSGFEFLKEFERGRELKEIMDAWIDGAIRAEMDAVFSHAKAVSEEVDKARR